MTRPAVLRWPSRSASAAGAWGAFAVRRRDAWLAAGCALMITAAGAAITYAPTKWTLLLVGVSLIPLASARGSWLVVPLTISFALATAAVDTSRERPQANSRRLIADLLLAGAALTSLIGILITPSALPRVSKRCPRRSWTTSNRGRGRRAIPAPAKTDIGDICVPQSLTGAQDAGTNLR